MRKNYSTYYSTYYKTIQWIIDQAEQAESQPRSLEYTRTFLLKVCILGNIRLTTQTSGPVRELVSKIIGLEKQTYKQLYYVSPNDVDGIMALGCQLFSSKNQLLQEFFTSAC